MKPQTREFCCRSRLVSRHSRTTNDPFFLITINLRIREEERTLCFDLRMIFSRPSTSDVTGDFLEWMQLMTTYEEYGLQRRIKEGMRNDFLKKVLKSTID